MTNSADPDQLASVCLNILYFVFMFIDYDPLRYDCDMLTNLSPGSMYSIIFFSLFSKVNEG